MAYLRGLHDKARRLRDDGVGDVPLEWLDGDAVRRLEPNVGERVIGALLSPKTGIVSSHELMEHLEKGASACPSLSRPSSRLSRAVR